MRFVNRVFTPEVGVPWTNKETLALYRPHLDRLPVADDVRQKLLDHVAFQLMGDRVRQATCDPTALAGFETRAAAFERGADEALDRLAAEVGPALTDAGVTLDAILTTTATGNLMPGLGYRMAQRLGRLVRPDAMTLDLANVGCTGGVKLLNLVRSLTPEYRQVLLVAVEVPTTLLDVTSTTFDRWQGNCTFGDGAAALWVSDDFEAGPLALAIEEVHPRQFAADGLDLIRWDYGNYYAFALRDHRTFDGEVRSRVEAALTEVRPLWQGGTRWAIHPAGIALLARLARPLGLAPEALHPSTAHYRRCSNMSSAGLLHILGDVAATAPVGEAVHLLTMGAGFTVIYGRVRRLR